MKDNKKRTGILLFFLSVVFLIAGISFGLASFFISVYNDKRYVISAAIMVFAGILYYISNQITKCEGGFTLIQAFFFYKRCKKAGVTDKPDKLNKTEKDILMNIALEYEYSRKYTTEQVQQLFKAGYDVEKMIK